MENGRSWSTRTTQTQHPRCKRSGRRYPLADDRSQRSEYCPVSSLQFSDIGHRLFGQRVSATGLYVLPTENERKYQRCDDARVTLDNELWRIDREFPPGDLLVRNRSGVRPVARCRVGDLTEVSPHRDVLAL